MIPRQLLPRLAAALLAVLLAMGAGGLAAQEPRPGTWERLPIQGGTLFTPANGPLIVWRERGSYARSDDAGETWTEVPVPVPQRTSIKAIDPTDFSILYLEGPGGLYKSVDGGVTVEPLLATGDEIEKVVVSPVDHNLVYLELSELGSFGRARLLRSRDGGATWEPVDEVTTGRGCSAGANILYPHPSEANRLFYQTWINCYTGAYSQQEGPLRQSTDQGASWSSRFIPPLRKTPRGLVGGAGAQPNRYYLFTRDAGGPAVTPGGKEVPANSSIFRTDDDGATWAEVANFENAFIGELVYDPADPDRLYAGFYALPGSGVRTSADGGITWTDLGSDVVKAASGLALGIDGRNLYATNQQGVWRLRLR